MKKTFFFIFLSTFFFGQNFELLNKIHHGDKSLPDHIAKEFFPGYKLVGTYSAEPTLYYEYLPADAKEQDLKRYSESGAVDIRIQTAFQDYESAIVFKSITGSCDKMVSLWKKEINPSEKYENLNLGFSFENKEKNVSYSFKNNGGNTCSIINRNLLIQ